MRSIVMVVDGHGEQRLYQYEKHVHLDTAWNGFLRVMGDYDDILTVINLSGVMSVHVDRTDD